MQLTITDDVGIEHHVLDVIPDNLPDLIAGLQREFPRVFPYGRCAECRTYAVKATLHGENPDERYCADCAAQLPLPFAGEQLQRTGQAVDVSA